METRSKSRKRSSVNKIDEPTTKKIKNVVDVASNDQTTEITHLNDDCLEHIFANLDLQDLVNITRLNNRFQYAARLVFKRNYGDKQIRIYSYGLSCDEISVDNRTISKTDVESFMQTFGDLISSIKLIQCARRIPGKMNSLLAYSLDSLVEIEFNYFPKNCWNKFSKPLSKVESICFNNCDLSGDLLLSEVFPKLCRMTVRSNGRNSRFKQIGTHFPCMKTLVLDLDAVNSNTIKYIDIERLLTLNSQITTLELNNRYYDNFELIRLISETLKLENLYIIFLPQRTYYGNEFHFKDVKNFRYYGDQFPFTFDQLEKLTLSHRFKSYHDKIINQNENLIKVTIEHGHVDIIDSTELGRIPKLTFNHLHLINVVECNAVAEFFNEKSFASKVKIKSTLLLEELRNGINKSKWTITSNGKTDAITLKRNVK